jgi:inorganic pyrophosphatase
MLHPWHDFDVGANPPEEICVVVEVPAGSRNRYELNRETGRFVLDRVLGSSLRHPGDCGFIPRTLAPHGGPCTVLVLADEATFTGCEISARPIGLLRLQGREATEERLIAVVNLDASRSEWVDAADVPARVLLEIQHFFQACREEAGGPAAEASWEGREAALLAILASMERYREAHESPDEGTLPFRRRRPTPMRTLGLLEEDTD